MASPTLAVLIPVRNEEDLIGACLDAVLGGSVVPDEVIVIDGGSTDGTRVKVLEYATRDERVRLIDNPDRIVPAALNRGFKESTADVIARVDGHAVISRTYLERARGHLASGSWQGVGGRKIPEARTRTGQTIAAAMSSRWGVGNSRYHYAAAAEPADHVPFGAYPREVIVELGGWDEDLAVNQDFEFDYRLRRAGGRILFDPAMASRWSCSQTIRDLAHQYYRYGRGKAKVAKKHPRSLRPRHLLPPTVAAGLVGSAVVGALTRHWLAGLGLVAYAVALGCTAFVGRAHRLPAAQRARFPAVIFVMHNAWGLGFLRGLGDRRGSKVDPFRPRQLELDPRSVTSSP